MSEKHKVSDEDATIKNPDADIILNISVEKAKSDFSPTSDTNGEQVVKKFQRTKFTSFGKWRISQTSISSWIIENQQTTVNKQVPENQTVAENCQLPENKHLPENQTVADVLV